MEKKSNAYSNSVRYLTIILVGYVKQQAYIRNSIGIQRFSDKTGNGVVCILHPYLILKLLTIQFSVPEKAVYICRKR